MAESPAPPLEEAAPPSPEERLEEPATETAGAEAPTRPAHGGDEDDEKSWQREYFEALLIAILFAVFARTYVLQAFKIPSGSMEQNLLIGDHILVNKFIYGPTASEWEKKLLPVRDVERGDVVVFKYPENPDRDFIKRCVGIPGDTVELDDKQLIINGEEVSDASYVQYEIRNLFPPSRSPLFNYGPHTVLPGYYFCLGDNRDNSSDSRVWGDVSRNLIKGRAFMVYWSFASAGPEPVEWPGVRGKLKQLAEVALHFFTSTRWERTFRVVR